MAIDPNIVELINADIDGEISSADKTELEALLAASPEAQALHAELSGLSASLDGLPELDPPPHLKHTIMASVPQAKSQQQRGNLLQDLLATPALRYAAMFVGGSVLTLSLVSSDQLSDNAFNDVTGLVGTMSDAGDIAPVASTVIHKAAVAGTITLRRADPILIIDFDLSTNGPIDIVATYDDKSVWFNGFAQLESTGTSISADGGQIRIQVDGKRRYAVYLHNEGSRKLSINLQFFSNGEPVHQAVLEYEQT